MAKSSYAIRSGLDQSFLDIEIALTSDDGMGLKPLPLSLIFAWIGSAALCAFIVIGSPVANLGIPQKIVFCLLWLIMSAYLFRRDDTGEMAFYKFPVLLSYIPRKNRHIHVRSGEKVSRLGDATNMAGCDEERGLLKFSDGDIGYLYQVVGSASVLLFEEDRDAIIDRVDAFYRKMKHDYELIFFTMRQSQDVKRQVANCDAKRQTVAASGDDELLALLDTDRAYLTDLVGAHFRSIHQYLLVKAPNEEALELGRTMLQVEVESSLLMIKRCVALYDDDLRDAVAAVIRGRESV